MRKALYFLLCATFMLFDQEKSYSLPSDIAEKWFEIRQKESIEKQKLKILQKENPELYAKLEALLKGFKSRVQDKSSTMHEILGYLNFHKGKAEQLKDVLDDLAETNVAQTMKEIEQSLKALNIQGSGGSYGDLIDLTTEPVSYVLSELSGMPFLRSVFRAATFFSIPSNSNAKCSWNLGATPYEDLSYIRLLDKTGECLKPPVLIDNPNFSEGFIFTHCNPSMAYPTGNKDLDKAKSMERKRCVLVLSTYRINALGGVPDARNVAYQSRSNFKSKEGHRLIDKVYTKLSTTLFDETRRTTISILQKNKALRLLAEYIEQLTLCNNDNDPTKNTSRVHACKQAQEIIDIVDKTDDENKNKELSIREKAMQAVENKLLTEISDGLYDKKSIDSTFVEKKGGEVIMCLRRGAQMSTDALKKCALKAKEFMDNRAKRNSEPLKSAEENERPEEFFPPSAVFDGEDDDEEEFFDIDDERDSSHHKGHLEDDHHHEKNQKESDLGGKNAKSIQTSLTKKRSSSSTTSSDNSNTDEE